MKHEPQRVELLATLDRPGLVILADSYYQGWRLRIDGKSKPIYRANRMMRAAAVPPVSIRSCIHTSQCRSGSGWWFPQ